MKKILIFLPALIILLAGCSNNSISQGTPTPGGASSTDPASSPQKFSDQSYFDRSHLIYPGTPDASAQQALSGFQISNKQMPDGSAQVTLKALDPSYHDQQYTVKPGEQLYFIEKMLGDDSGNNEANLRDDSAVIVNSDGNIVQQPLDFTK